MSRGFAPNKEIFEDIKKNEVPEEARAAFKRKPYKTITAEEYLKDKVKDGVLDASM